MLFVPWSFELPGTRVPQALIPVVPLRRSFSGIREFRAKSLISPNPSEQLVVDTDSEERSHHFVGYFPE